MVTNARGTAHPKTGRIDLVQQWLDENVPCAARCLWRDEIDRRFDSAPVSLKFKYPELLTGQDGIELALSQLLGPQRERQMRVVRAFASSQFDRDAKVKFKQVSLSNSLADLFIDIPIRFSESLARYVRRRYKGDDQTARRIERELVPSIPSEYTTDTSRAEHYFHSRIGAAEFLLGRSAQENLTRVVLEGAPGQGKSTLAQFVCQVQRAKLLQRSDFLDGLPPVYGQSSFRLPIKIDLRDLAMFVSSADDPGSASLDQFVSDLIHRESGNQSFGVDDLLDVITSTPVLFFMDGLDEIADLGQRRRLIESVQQALVRYEGLNIDCQVVVTSRPSVFGKKAKFDESGFVTIDLASIDKRLALEYSKKWVGARGLDSAEAADLLSILGDKMTLPHIVELMRNPMQLTILLSLIHQIGYSLPDQRTDLYRRYLELFLIREAEKTPSVKRHSALLVSFIQHLAWILQSQAESAGSRGSISEDELQVMARSYLRDAGQPEELADDLFGGGLERIFVLVQRVSGLYEFEVQPLREFFCARHLYETSPVGTYRSQSPRGDRAQRFEALAANPFWLNVTRFYAGSYEPGEIGSLVLSLKDLASSADSAIALHARRVAFALISDWVFVNKRSWQDQLIRAVCDPIGIDLLSIQAFSEGEIFAFDEDCGQATLRDLLFGELMKLPPCVRAHGYCALLAANGGAALTSQFLHSLESETGRSRSIILRRMVLSGAADTLSMHDVMALADVDGPPMAERAARLSAVVEGLSAKLLSEESALQEVVTRALDGEVARSPFSTNLLGVFIDLLSPSAGHLLQIAIHRDPTLLDNETSRKMHEYAAPAGRIPEFLRKIFANFGQQDRHFGPSFEHAANVSDLIERQFDGVPWAAYALALRAAGMPTRTSVRSASRMFDDSSSLSARAKYARLKRNSTRWWRDQLADADGDCDREMFWAALVLAWTSPSVYNELGRTVERIVDGLSEGQVFKMSTVLRCIARDCAARRDRENFVPH